MTTAKNLNNLVTKINKMAGLKVYCAWCGKYMYGTKEPVSHGICEECYEKNFPRYRK